MRPDQRRSGGIAFDDGDLPRSQVALDVEDMIVPKGRGCDLGNRFRRQSLGILLCHFDQSLVFLLRLLVVERRLVVEVFTLAELEDFANPGDGLGILLRTEHADVEQLDDALLLRGFVLRKGAPGDTPHVGRITQVGAVEIGYSAGESFSGDQIFSRLFVEGASHEEDEPTPPGILCLVLLDGETHPGCVHFLKCEDGASGADTLGDDSL